MGLLDRVKNKYVELSIGGNSIEQYKAKGYDVPGWLQATGGANAQEILYTPVEQTRLYTQLSWIQTAISMIAQTAITSRLAVKKAKKVDDKEQDIDNHPFEELLQRPNPWSSRSEFIAATVSFYALSGNAYWWLNRKNEKAPPDELWVIPSAQIRPVPDKSLGIKGYIYDPGDGKEMALETWEIVHFKRFNPNNPYIGMSVIEALKTVSLGDIAMQKWNTNLFDKDNAKVPGALAFGDPIDDGSWAKIKADINFNHGGTKRSMMMLRNVGKGGVQWINMAFSQKDMDFLAGRLSNRNEIYSALGPGLASILDTNATEANAIAGKQTFIEFGVWPHLVNIQEKITNDLLPIYGEGLRAEFDDIRVTDRTLALAEQTAFAQVHTIDEIRQEQYGDKPIGDARGTLLVAQLAHASSTSFPSQPSNPADITVQATPVAIEKPVAQLPDNKQVEIKPDTSKAMKLAAMKMHTGVMIALFIPPEVAMFLAGVQAFLPMNSTPTLSNEFHITLAYLGDMDTIDTRTTTAITNALYDFSSTMPTLTGRFNGIGRFQAVGDDGTDALYVSFDCKELQDWRHELIERLRLAGVNMSSEHGFIPHVTLGYIPSNAVTPMISLPLFDMTFGDMWACFGDSRQNFRLQQVVPIDDFPTETEMATEIKRFKTWLKKRNNPDVSRFKSELLTDEHKAKILADLTVTPQEDGPDQHFFTLMDGRIIPESLKAAFTLIDFGDEDSEEVRVSVSKALEERSADEIKAGFSTMLDDMFPPGSKDDSPEAITERVKRNTKLNGKVKDALAKALQDSSDLGVSFSAKQLEKRLTGGFDWTLVLGEGRDWAKEYAGELIKQINETSKRTVQEYVSRWFDAGDPLDKLIKDLTPVFGESRASLIAATEVTRAAFQGQLIAYGKAGFAENKPTEDIPKHVGCRCWVSLDFAEDGTVYYLFRTSNDDLTCPICVPLNEKRIGIAKSA